MKQSVVAFSVVALAVAALAQTAEHASAATITTLRPVNNTADEQLLLSKALGTAEARAGTRTVSGDWEAGQYFTTPTVSNPFAQTGISATQRQVAWSSGHNYPFELSFSRSTGVVTWTITLPPATVGGQPTTVSSTQTFTDPTELTGIVVRARGDTRSNAIASMSLTGMTLSEVGLAPQSVPDVVGPQQTPDFVTGMGLGILGLEPTRDFTLGGSLRLDWTSNYLPSGSQVSMQLKMGTAIPEPAALGLLAPAGVLLGRRRR